MPQKIFPRFLNRIGIHAYLLPFFYRKFLRNNRIIQEFICSGCQNNICIESYILLDFLSLLYDDLKKKLSALEDTRRNMEIYWQQDLEDITNEINVQVL